MEPSSDLTTLSLDRVEQGIIGPRVITQRVSHCSLLFNYSLLFKSLVLVINNFV